MREVKIQECESLRSHDCDVTFTAYSCFTSFPERVLQDTRRTRKNSLVCSRNSFNQLNSCVGVVKQSVVKTLAPTSIYSASKG